MDSPIVITGMGMVSPLGCGVNKVWKRLVSGNSGIGPITRFATENPPIKIAGLVPDLDTDPEAGFDIDRGPQRTTQTGPVLALRSGCGRGSTEPGRMVAPGSR